MEVLLAAVLLTIVALLVARPLLAAEAEERRAAALREELEAARDAKYRQIREAELDFRAGKLAEADWRRADRELRREAVAILRRLDELDAEPAAAPEARGAAAGEGHAGSGERDADAGR